MLTNEPNLKKYVIKTLGCKANFSDSQSIEAELQRRGWSAASDDLEADLCIVNSCTVTDEADKQSKNMAKQIARRNNKVQVVFTGCGAEVDPESYKKSPGIHYVVGNQNKPEMLDLILKSMDQNAARPEEAQILGSVTSYDEMKSRHPMDREWPMPIGMDPGQWIEWGNTARTRVFMKIQEGCNSFCTYCIIPYGRGPNRSLKPGELVRQVQALTVKGVREIVLTGTNIGDYGTDWSESKEMMLGDLLKQLLAHTTIERIRVSSLDPTEVTDEILELMELNPRLCPHFHISMQSPHSKVLKLMKRKYTQKEASDCLNKIARLKTIAPVFVGMDVITGFPGEGDQEFEESYEWFKAHPWSRLHVFPYSERQGTPATRLGGIVPVSVRKDRARRLMELSTQRLEIQYHQGLQTPDHPLFSSVLIEGRGSTGSGNEWVMGYTSNYWKVAIPGSLESLKLSPNQTVQVRPQSVMLERASGDASFLVSLS